MGFGVESLEPRRLLATVGFSGIPEWQSAWLPSLNNTNTTLPAQSNPTSGAVNAVAPHPTDPNILLVATVNGGIWRSRTAQDISIVGYRPGWTPLTDRYPASSFGDIVFDRTDANNNTIWASIARQSSGNSDGGPRGGLLRSTDGGDTWVPMAQASLGGFDVIKVIPTRLTNPANGAQIVLAAALTAFFRSVDGGNNFTQLSGAAGSGLPVSLFSDVVADPTNNNVFYAAMPTNGVFRSLDGGATWGAINTGANGVGGVTSARRIRLAATNGALYAAAVNGTSGQLTGVYRLANPSVAASTTWTSMGVPETPAAANGTIVGASNASPIVITSNNPHGLLSGTRARIAGVNGNGAANGDWQITVVNPTQFSLDGTTGNGGYTGGGTWTALSGIHPRVRPGGQGNTHLSLVADPNNANIIYIGGDRSNNRSAGNLWRGTFGATPNVWNSIVDGNANGTAPHADSRDMEFNAAGHIIEGDDGGVNRLINVGTSGQVWQSLVGSLEAHEVYSVALTSGGPAFGTQDTGTPGPNLRDTNGSTFTTYYHDYSGGDGAYVAWDSTSLPSRDILYASNQFMGGFKRHFFNLSTAWEETQNLALTILNAGGSTLTKIQPNTATSPPQFTFDNSIQFIQPYVLNAVNPVQMLVGTNSLYESLDRGDNFTAVGGLINQNIAPFLGDSDRDGAADEGDEFVPAGVLVPALLTDGIDNDGAGGVDDSREAGITAMVYGGGTGALANAAVIYAAVRGNLFLRQNGNGLPTAITAPPGVAVIRDIALDPDDWRIAYVVDSNGNVFQTNDSTATPIVWTSLTGDINNIATPTPGTFTADLRTIEVFKSGATRAVFVGGSGGVFFTTGAAAGAHWREFGNFLPNVVVKDLQYDSTYGSILAGTWGRGVWAVGNLTSLFTAGNLTTLKVTGDNDAADETDIISLARDPNLPNLLRLSVRGSITGTERKYSVEASSLDRIQIETVSGNDTYNISDLPAGVTLDINVRGSNAVISLAKPTGGGIRNNISGAVTIRGEAGGTTRLTVDDSTNPGFGFTVNVSTLVAGGSIVGLAGQPVTYDATANINTVSLLTSAGGNNIVNITATQVPTFVNFNRFAPAAAGSTVNIGNGAGSVQTIAGPITIADRGAFASINVLDAADFGIPAIRLDQLPPQPGGEPFGRLTGLAPAAISFKMSDLNRFNVATGRSASAIVVNGPGSPGGQRQAIVTSQPNVTIADMDLNGGITTNSASSLEILNNLLGDTRINGGAAVRLDGNRIANLTVTAGAANVTISNNPSIGAVAISGAATAVNLSANTITGLASVAGSTGVTFTTNTIATVELAGSGNITMTGNTVTGNVTVGTTAARVRPASLTNNTIRGNLTVNRGSLVFAHNNTIVGRTVINGGTITPVGARVSGADEPTEIDFQNNRVGALELAGPAIGIIRSNDLGWRESGAALSPVTVLLSATFVGPIDNNDVRNGVVGVQYNAPSPLVANRIYGNTTGVVMPVNDMIGGLGYAPGSGRNEIYNNASGVNLTGRMRNQWVRNNTTGVIGSGILGPETLDDANLIEANATGADFTGTIQFNRFARNAVGIAATDRQIVRQNLIYRGTAAGIKTRGADDVRIVHNTFYTTAGSGVLVDGTSERAELLNNIFQADGGYNYFVADDSRSGFFSDYNDLYSTGSGKIVRYAGDDYTDILALQQELNFLDLHSIGSSAASPTFAAPRFVNLAADDYRTAALSGGLRSSSPTIDTASSAVDVPAPPGSRNLLTNPSFESGTGSWTVNVGGATKNSAPAPFAFGGLQYFYAGAVATGFAEQTVNLLTAGFTAAQLDARTFAAVWGGRLRSATEFPADDGRLLITFLDGAGNAMGPAVIQQSANADDRWELLGGRARLPVGARAIRYRFEAIRRAGTNDDAYFDGAFLDVRPDASAPDMGAYGGAANTDIDQAAAHIQIVFPDLYTDWELTAPRLIQWQTLGNTTGSPVRIDLYQDSPTGPVLLRNLTASTPDTGAFTFIPEAYGLSVNTRGLRIRVSLVSDASVTDTSSEAFAIPEAGNNLYINDGSTNNDEYTTAVGDFRNTGRSPASPKPSLPALLRNYTLGGADVVRIDTGSYEHDDTITLSGNSIFGGDQGVTVTGPTNPARVARIDFPEGAPAFDVVAASFVTLSRLTIGGASYGVWVRNGSTRFTGSQLTLTGNSLDGIRLEADATEARLDGITASNNGRDGISIASTGAVVTAFKTFANFNAGLLFTNAGSTAVVTGGESYGNKYGIHITYNVGAVTPASVGDPDLSRGLGNRVHDNSINGIVAIGAVRLAGNTVYNTAGAGANSAGVGILLASGATAIANVAFGNFVGILSDAGAVTNNRVFNNASAGISTLSNVLVQGNVVYSNGVGVVSQNRFAGPTLRNNLIYANGLRGVWIRGHNNTLIENNTIYQLTGDAVRIDLNGGEGALNVVLRNNVLWAQGPAAGQPTTGFAISVDPSSEVGFRSDYNLLYTTGAGRIGYWENEAAATLAAWRIASFTDGSSISRPPLFVDVDGADNLLGYVGGADRGSDDDFHEQSTAGSFHGGSLAPVLPAPAGLPVFPTPVETADGNLSPALDRGDPASAFVNEPSPNGGFVNLGAYGNSAQASRSPAAYVRVLSPDGGESVLAGRNFDVLWRSHDATGTVNIELLRGASPQTAVVVQSIAAGAPNNGRFAWAVPAALAAGNDYYVRITRVGGAAAADTSDAPFVISGIASPFFYVNDGTALAGDWTTAPGSDSNDGLTPATPMRSIRALLEAYDLGPGDVVRVDVGMYTLNTNIVVTANDSGVSIIGYHDPANAARRAVLSRAAAAGAAVFEFQGADDVTLDRLAHTGGAAVGITAGAGADSDGVTIIRSELFGFAEYAILVHGTNDNWTVADNRVHDNSVGFYRAGIVFDSLGGAYAGTIVRDNVVYNNPRTGISLENAGAGTTVSGNEVYGNQTGISVSAQQGAPVTVSGNKVHDNVSIGILASGPTASVTGNSAWRQGRPQSPAANDPNAQGIQTQNGATASGNVAYDNGYGIFVNGGGTASNNRAYGNLRAGIYAGGANAIGNVVYNNQTGLEGVGSPLWSNNLAYNNSLRGLYLVSASQPQIINNTAYQPTGDALTVESTHNNLTFQNIRIRNNILWAQSGYAIVLGTDTAPGLQSDYNDLFATGAGKVGLWENIARNTLLAWQQVTLGDANSISADPRFVDAAGGDFHEQSTYGSFRGGSLAPALNPATGLPASVTATETNDAVDSPAVDAGKPTDPATNEPSPNGGFVNLGAYGNTAQASKSPLVYLQITRPSGGEAWSTRQTFPVQWRGDNPGVGLVDIELLHRGAGGALTLESTIASGVANNGRYDWVVPQTIPAGSDYVIRVTRRPGADATAASDVSDAVFSIGAGTGIYYVNDATVNPGDWTTAPGDDANSGLDPAQPKATIAGVLAAYALGATDVIRVDAGNYALSGNVVITPADSGVTIRGYFDPAFPDRKAVLDRGSRATNAFVFEIAGADDVTIDRLSMAGAYLGLVGPFNADADRLTLRNSEIFGMSWYGIYVGGQNDDWNITGNRVYGNYTNIQTESAARASITGNLVYSSTFGGGIQVSNGQGATVSGNEVYGNNGAGIVADNASVTNNLVHDNRGGGMVTYGGVLATGNTVYGHAGQNVTGIYNQGAVVRGNTIYGNFDGLVMNGGTSAGNRIFNNSNNGIYIVGGTAQGNVVYSNLIGIAAAFSPSILGNLSYGNTAAGISIGTAGNALIDGNTVYQLTGDAMRLSLDTNNTRLSTSRVRNNILWAAGAGGYALTVTNDSDTGFASDYNDLYATGGAKVARWSTQDFATFREWQWEMGQDAHGFSTDPQFVDPDGADNVLGYRPVSAGAPGDFGADDNFRLAPGSPAIDAADPTSAWFAEPLPNGGRANLGNYGNTPDATPSAAGQLIQVLSPNGGEKVQAGRPVTVDWRSSGLTQNRVVGLLNLGGAAVPSASGEWASADVFATSRMNFTRTNASDFTGVPNPAPPEVYRTLAFADSGIGNLMSYRLPIANGTYTIRLHWSEGFVGAGQRKFDVKLQGAVVRSEFDVYAAAGGYYRATALSFPVTVTDGGVVLELVNKTINPAFLSGIDITAANAGGVAAPTADVQLSLDGGATWATLAAAQPMDALGRGTFTFVPSASSDNARVRVIARDGTLPLDASDAAFQIAPAGRDFYVNDGATAGDLLSTAPGDNANHGKSPAKPMASIAAVLAMYDLDPGDVIHVDSGAYSLSHNTMLQPQDSGVAIRGVGAASDAPTARLSRGNLTNGIVFDFRGASDVTIDHLAMSGANSAVVSYYGVDSDRVVISNNDIFNNRDYGVFIANISDGWIVAGNRVHDTSGGFNAGISFNGLNGIGGLTTIRDNVIFNNPRYGIIASAGTGMFISGNEVFGNGAGISADTAVVSNNRIYNNVIGLAVDGSASALRNIVYGNVDGITTGISGGGTGPLIDGNRIFRNSGVGVSGFNKSTIRNNSIYSNGIGVRGNGPSFADQIVNNLIYANASQGILLNGSSSTRLLNNTIYQAVGDAIRLQSSSNNISVYGNILWVEAGADIYVSADSQTNFKSDYNLLHRGAGAQAVVGSWGGISRATLADWQTASGQDARSVAGDPSFVDVDGADNTLGYNPAGLGYDGGADDNFYVFKGSPAIDRGPLSAPATDYEGAPRTDDPATPNAGEREYAAAPGAAGQFVQSGALLIRSNNNWVRDYVLPFAFPFYDASYTTVTVSTEGLLHFAGPDVAYDSNNTEAVFLRNRRIAPLWDNVNVSGAADGVFVDASVAGQIKFTWKGLNEANAQPVNFSAVLFSDGRIRFDYGAGNTGLTPTVGVSMGDGRHYALPAGHNGATALANAASVDFTLVPGFVDIGAYEFRGRSDDAIGPTVTATVPAAIGTSGAVAGSVRTIALTFSEPLNSVDARAAGSYRLIGTGPDLAFGTGDDVVYILAPRYASGAGQVLLDVASGPLTAGSYRFTAFGGSQTALHDLSGLRLDGDANGTPGGDYVRDFTIAPDGRAPAVVGVWVDGVAWSPAFRNFLQTRGLGSADLGFAVPGGVDQLLTLPWTNLDRVSVRFSEDVSVTRAQLAVTGSGIAGYRVSAFSYNPVTFTATWTLAAPVAADKLLLRLDAGAGGVKDFAGNPLDGEWAAAGDSFPSGDGVAGGHFLFRMNVLPGAAGRGTSVGVIDLARVRASLTRGVASVGPGARTYSAFYDLDGSGAINARDVLLARAGSQTRLPTANPAAPTAAPASVALRIFSSRRISYVDPGAPGAILS